MRKTQFKAASNRLKSACSLFIKMVVISLVGILFAAGCTSDKAQTADEADNPEEESRGAYQTMDYGPIISESIKADWPENSLIRKGLAIRLEHDAAMIFDTDLMRLASGTTGGWLDISKTDYTSYKGSDIAAIEGRQVFASSEIAGWAKDGSFYGPREDGLGNLPYDWAHYQGYYRYGDRIVLSYSVGKTQVLESPWSAMHKNSPVFIRTIQVAPSDEPKQALILEEQESWFVEEIWDQGIMFKAGDTVLAVSLINASEGIKLATDGSGRLVLHFQPSADIQTVNVAHFEMESADDVSFEEVERVVSRNGPDLEAMTDGGEPRWEEEISISGTLADTPSGYVIDRIPIPFDNPWGAWMRLSGLDFFEDGTRAVVTTWNGDVWIISEIDETLENVRWRRFASGLFYPMGVAVVDGEIFVTERSQLTRLYDLNGNGEADFYENINNDGIVYPMAHSLGLEVDSKGNFYFFKNGNRVPGEVPSTVLLSGYRPTGTNGKFMHVATEGLIPWALDRMIRLLGQIRKETGFRLIV